MRSPAIAVHAAMIAVLAGHAAAATIRTEYREDGQALEIEATARVDARPATVWNVLTDYARYPEFIPDAQQARVVRRARSAVTVEQSWSLAFGLLKLPLEVVYDIVESPPDEIRSSAVVGRIGTLRSRYTVEPLEQDTVLRYRGRFASASRIAFAFQSGPAREVMSRQFQALVDEIERFARATETRHLPASTVGTVPSKTSDVTGDGSARAPASRAYRSGG